MNKPMSLTIDADGNIVVAAPTDGAEVLVAKFTPTGQLLWQRAVSPAMPGDEERDSVSPLLLDGPSSLGSSRLALGRRHGRLAAASVVAACAFTIGIAGLGVLEGPAPTSPSARSLGTPVTDLALRAAAAPVAPAPVAPAPQAPVVESEPLEVEAPLAAPATSAPRRAERSESPQLPVPAVSPSAPAATEIALPRPAELRAETLALLQRGELAAAADRARTLVVLAPSDAFSYLLLGAALQDQGLAGEARAVYYACAQNAHGGSVAECMALAGVSPTATAPITE